LGNPGAKLVVVSGTVDALRGGSERMMLKLCLWASRRYRVTAVLPNSPANTEIQSQLRSPNVDCRFYDLTSARRPGVSSFPEMVSLFRRLRPDAVVFYQTYNQTFRQAIVAARMASARRIVCIEGTSPYAHVPGGMRSLLGQLLRMKGGYLIRPALWNIVQGLLVDRFLIKNRRDRQLYIRECGYPSRKCSVLGSAVNPTTYAPCPTNYQQFRASNGISPQDCLVVFVGRLSREKAVDDLLAAFEKVRQRNTCLKLWIVGDGNQYEELRDFVVENELSSHVRFWGWQPNVVKFLQAADIYVQTSRCESGSNSLLEAMSCKLPVVASNTNGSMDTIRPGINGLTFHVGDTDALADHLAALADQPDLRVRLGTAARAQILTGYSPRVWMNRLARFLEIR